MSKVPTQGALAAAAKLQRILDRMPQARWVSSAKLALLDESPEWIVGTTKIKNAILDDGGRYKEDWNGCQVHLWGFKATSTSGLVNAVRNWIAQVRAKADMSNGTLT